MSFAVVGEREDGDKVGEVVLVVVLDTKVIHHQDEGDGAGDMAEEAGWWFRRSRGRRGGR